MSSEGTPASGWTFVTNHTQVLLCVAREPDIRLRDIATRIGITERAAQRILADLVEAGYVERRRQGRRNRYTIKTEMRMRHSAQNGHDIGEVLEVLGGDPPTASRRQASGPADGVAIGRLGAGST
jgi:DNA-binding transcriptional ArsR family regulator